MEMRSIRLDPQMTPIGHPLREQCPLHLLPGGGEGSPWCRAVLTRMRTSHCWRRTSSDLLGLPQRRSRLDIDAVRGGEGHKRRDVAARGVAVTVTGGQHVRGSRNTRVGELVPRLSTRHNDGTRHVKQAFKRIGDTVVDVVNKFFNKGTCQSPGFGGLGLVPLGRVGPFILWTMGRVISGMWWRGGTVGWLGKMPRSSHHWACTACHSKGRLQWSACGSLA